MVESMHQLDGYIGEIMDEIKKLGIEKNTLVVVMGDNGAFKQTMPESGYTDWLFRGVKGQTLEGGVFVKSMNLVPRCAEEFNRCWDKATKVYNECPPGADGTYTHCTRTKQTTWLACAREEIDCTARELGCR